MRQIKFRAWDIEGKCWIPQPLCIIDHLGNLCTWDENESRYLKETIPYEVVWFTGLMDKNGKEIWEGDVLKTDLGNIFDVNILNLFQGDPKFWNVLPENCEVLGNIYENPSLLTQGEVG